LLLAITFCLPRTLKCAVHAASHIITDRYGSNHVNKAMKSFTLFLLRSLLVLKIHAVAEEAVFRWASTGGGWRAQAAVMGFSNIFAQAGLIQQDSSLFSGISTQSGASWFSTQFFYSEQFFENITTSTPDQLYDFVLAWMNSYQTFSSQNSTSGNLQCDIIQALSNTTFYDILAEYCNLIIDYQGDWAAFIYGMYEAAATDYGDAGLADRPVNGDNRVTALSDTDLYVQTALVANSRVRNATGNDTATYLGPSQMSSMLNSIPLCVDWAVTNSNSFYATNQPELSLGGPSSWTTHVGETSSTFRFDDWDSFPLYPGEDGTTSIPVLDGTSPLGNLQQPFFSGQTPTVAQIGAASSAAAGFIVGSVPSTLAQAASFDRYQIQSNTSSTAAERARNLTALTVAINRIYQSEILDDFAVCSQWPETCSEEDGRFVDGYIADELTLALNIAIYQMQSNGDVSKTLRVILTANNRWQHFPFAILSYFNTTFNQGVDPGAFLWPAEMDQHMNLPLYSNQIFDSYLDFEMLNNISQPIEGMNVTTALLKATTIENPAFHTMAGQSVEILYIALNSNIPTNIIGETLIEEWKVPIADMARDIAENKVLLSRVESFVKEDETASAGCVVHVDWILTLLPVLMVAITALLV
jgi:hypothetical protein